MAEVTRRDIIELEKFADRILSKFKIDVEFTKHFTERVNDERNSPNIDISELQRLFRKIEADHGDKLKSLKDNEAVLKDIQSDLNLPFVLSMNKKKELEVTMKTVMRKKDFKSTNKSVVYEGHEMENVITINEAYKEYDDDDTSSWSDQDLIRYGKSKGYTATSIVSTKKLGAKSLVLFELRAFDKTMLNKTKIKEGEKIYRYISHATLIGKMMPFIKMNRKKGLLYFLTDDSSKENYEIVSFEAKGEKMTYARFAPSEVIEEMTIQENVKELFLSEALVNPDAPDKAAIERRKRLQAIRDKHLEKDDDYADEKPKSRKIAGHRYGGAKQKDDLDEYFKESYQLKSFKNFILGESKKEVPEKKKMKDPDLNNPTKVVINPDVKYNKH
jgi:hypothetical protein